MGSAVVNPVRKPSQRDVLAAWDAVIEATRNAKMLARLSGPRELVEWTDGKVIDAMCDRHEVGVLMGEPSGLD